MKNIQIIDGSVNSIFEIYCVDEDIFQVIFPEDRDIAFIDDLKSYLNYERKEIQEFWSRVYGNRVDKKKVIGIHGTLHLQGSYCESVYFPNRKEISVKTEIL